MTTLLVGCAGGACAGCGGGLGAAVDAAAPGSILIGAPSLCGKVGTCADAAVGTTRSANRSFMLGELLTETLLHLGTVASPREPQARSWDTGSRLAPARPSPCRI